MSNKIETNEFKIILSALLNQQKTKKQINQDIKRLEQSVNSLKLVATFSRAATKKELNAYIAQLSGQLSVLKLKARIDDKKLQGEINRALNRVSVKDIDALDIDESKVRLKARKVVADTKAYVQNNPVMLNVDLKKEKLDNQLTAYLNRNTKINESEALLKEADIVRDRIAAINDKDSLRYATDSFQLFRSEVQSTGFQAKSTADKVKGMISGITKIGSVFGVASLAVNHFVSSLQTLKKNDTILTEIGKTSEMTRKQLTELGNEAFDMAGRYGRLSSDYLTGVQEMARSGYEDLSKELGELSLLAQSAGDMSADMANNYLLATDAAYRYSGSVEKLNAALDGANYISNKNSASLTDIADATRVSASFAANAGVSIDQLTAAEATMIATTKRGGSEMGRAFRSILLNLQQVSGEFDGEVIDEEQLKKVEARCHSLGVELEYMKDGIAALRNPMDVLKELAEVYNSLPDNSADKQGLISDLGGKYHSNALSGLLSRWDLYEKMLSEYSQGTGSALEEAYKTADSWEGRLNSLQNSWDSLVNSITSKEAVKGGITFLDHILELAEKLSDTLGEIPVLLTVANSAMVAGNKDYGLTQIINPETKKLDVQGNLFGIDFSAIKEQRKHFADAENAISAWNDWLANGKTGIEGFNGAIVESNKQLKAYIQTTSKDAPASLEGYKAYLRSAGESTDALRLKTILLNSAVTMLGGMAIQAVITGLYQLSQVSSNVAQKAQELGNSFKTEKAELDSYKEKISELYAVINDSGSSVQDITIARQNLMSVQDELIEKFGHEKETIELITGAIYGQADALDRLTDKQWQAAKNEFNDGDFWNDAANFFNGYSDNIDRMVNQYGNYSVTMDLSKYGGTLFTEGYDDFKQTLMSDFGAEISDAGSEYLVLSGNASDVYQKLLDIQKLLKDAEDFKPKEDFNTYLGDLANSAKDVTAQYEQMYDQYILYEKVFPNDSYAESLKNINEAYDAYQNAFTDGDQQKTDKAIENYADALVSAMDSAMMNGDTAVADYFKGMYPELQAVMDRWEFRTKILPAFDTSELEGKNQNDILEMLQTDGTDKGEDIFQSIVAGAKEYGFITDDNAEGIQKVLDLLVEWGILQGEIDNQSVGNEKISFDFSTYEEDIDDIQSAISTLRSALDSFNKGELDKESVLDLLQEFPALAKYTDLAAEGFGNLSEGLSELIAQQPDALIQNLESLKSMLDTEEEREQVDLLINSLQRLTSYGDTGNEAYAAATGNTWNDTANVIEGVTAQFENLAKVQEAVADGLTMSATAAAELAKMYPEILTQSEVTANGQIKLNEDVVKSILAGDQSIINAQITKLEADKAELTAKKENALAQLELANQVATGRSRLTEDELRLKIEAMNQELDGAIEKDTQISESFADTTDSVVDNMITMNDTAGNVASDIATNMGNAAENMAGNMAAGARAVQISLSDIMKKASDVAKSIAGMISGEIVGNADTVYQGAGSGGKRKKGIEIVKTASKQDSVTSSYLKDEITLDEFRNGLQTDISGYEQAISNIDSQIEVLKNLQLTFENTVSSANGGIGGHNYANKIKELEKEKDRINNALDDKKGSGSDKDEFEETVDYFERRIKVLDDAVNILKSGMENVTGAFARNNLLDAQLGITEEKFNNYTDAMAMYTQKANEALSKLPADIAEKVKNGAVDLTTYIGDGNKAVTEAINEYEKWSDKVTDCRQELEELKTAIRQLELEKFNNIMDDFTDQFDLRDDANSLIDKQIALLKEAGQLIGESFYTAQADQAKKQLALLEEEKAKLVEQLNSAIGSGRVQKGTEEWLEMVSALSDVDGSILDCKKSIEEFDNAILELHTEIFNRIQEQFSDLDSELSNLSGLFDDDSKVSDGLGNWINNGLAQLGLLTQQYELAKYRVQQYNTEIDELNKQYLAGKYSATEYTDKLADLTQGQWDSVSAMREAETSIMSLNETRIEEEIDTIEKEIDAFKKLTDAQIEALRAARDLHEYQTTIADKTKKIADIQRQLSAMQNDTSASTIAKRKKLEAELADAKADLEEYEYDHSVSEQENALNKEYEKFEQEKNDEIEKLRESLENRELMIGESFEAVKNNSDLIGQEIVITAQNHGITVSDALISAWQKGEMAIAGYGTVLSAGTSAFIGNIMMVENEVWNLQAQADVTADTLAYMFATRADTLVNELNTAYYSEANLNTMTQTLHDTLTNTLERGYNISSIMSSLESIKNAAIDAANAVNSVGAGGGGNITHTAPATPSNTQNAASNVQNAVDKTLSAIYVMDTNPSNGQYLIKNKLTGKIVSTHGSEKAAMNALKKLRGYAGGTRNLKENLFIKDEEGYELTLPKLSEGRYAIEPPGTQILTKKQTDNLFRLAQMDPDMQKSVMIPNPAGTLMKFPEMTERNVTPQMNLHYDSLITLNGDVNDTNHFLKQIETVAQGAIKKSWKDAMWECKKKGAW